MRTNQRQRLKEQNKKPMIFFAANIDFLTKISKRFKIERLRYSIKPIITQTTPKIKRKNEGVKKICQKNATT